MRYDIYVGKTLYHSTYSLSEAFAMFRRWIGGGLNVNMRFNRVNLPR
jgi:hypothetical protein